MTDIAFRKRNRKITNVSPTRLIVASFALYILFAGILLTLPAASANGESAGFLDALFTATSATCVTGLVVRDTLTEWSVFGQLVILFSIQIGGLGIVTFGTFFTVLLGRKISMKGRVLAQESLSYYTYDGVLILIKNIVLITFYIEFIGGLLLASRFVPEYGAHGVYMGFFHAVSAFCNAGFDLTGNYRSLTEYSNDPLVLYTTALLIVIGGLGFMVWRDIYEHPRLKGLYLHTKLVLIMTATLIVAGSVFFLISEYSNPMTMGPLGFIEKINAAVFHSITCRTAGFNSLSTNDMSEISKIATILLMYIGAAPGSTGGGVKVTTAGVIIMAIVSNIKGSDETIILKRKVPNAIVFRSLSIVGLSMMLIFIMTTIIIGIEDINFINILYEVTSAFGTVGLSTGITPTLQPVSKIMLIITMFLGRVGPVTFAIALAMRAQQEHKGTVYPEGKIAVG